MTKLRIIISGGGTGGHIYPAIAVAQALQKITNNNIEFLFVGAKDRMEMEKVPKAGYKIVGLWISGLQRRLTIRNLLFPIKVVSSLIKSIRILNEFKPHAAVGFGGYASGTLLYAATLKKIPSLIHEQNSYAGITNKILKNRVNRICVAYDGMQAFFPPQKLTITGNPVRQNLLDVSGKRVEAMQHFKLDPDKKTLLVMGGSLGARTINDSVFEGLVKIEEAGINLIWQTGKGFDASTLTPHNFISSRLSCQPFIYEMNLAYAAADVVVSRAGALSIAELCMVAKPLILVPSPNVAEDHQTKNAEALVEQGAAILITDREARRKLVDETLALLNNDKRRQELKTNIAKLGIADAAEKIAREVLKLTAAE